jgi:tRNA modification GTPase
MTSSVSHDTICAVSTPAGTGGIAVIRVSGPEALPICDALFVPQNKHRRLATQPSYTVSYGFVGQGNDPLDHVLASVFRAPHSFTGDDTVEIACHGSLYIQQQILQLLIDRGCRIAQPGEFTQRAFLNGKMDLSQAEAVADLIASTSAGMHKLALNQMRGGFSKELTQVREQLLHFASLIELELDFSEEDVTFADRTQLRELAQTIQRTISRLIDSFSAGNAIKNGIPVAIIGAPNTGKSTLLNALLNEERAIVSDIPGTTRDTIEETLHINGQLFRFIDTAGLRQHPSDPVEALGIQRSFEKAEKADVILYLFDLTKEDTDDLVTTSQWLQRFRKPILMIGTKNDLARRSPIHTSGNVMSMYISCKEPIDIERIKQRLLRMIDLPSVGANDVIVTNLRHYEALCGAHAAVVRVMEGLSNGLSGDFLAQDIRECMHYLGQITGEISTDEVLGNIFRNFCIGK